MNFSRHTESLEGTFPRRRKTYWSLLKESSRYGLSSLFLLLFNLSVTATAHELWGWPEHLAFLFAQGASLLAAYLLMKYYVRRTGKNPIRREFSAFVVSSILLRGAEYLAFVLILEVTTMNYLLTATLIKGGFFVGKFFFYRSFVFRSPTHPEPSENPDDRARRDRELFDSIAWDIAAKDLSPGSSKARCQRISQTLASLPIQKAGTLLEVGCGAGFGSRYIEGFYEQYTGIDYSSAHIEQAKRIHSTPDRSFHTASLEDFRPAQLYDVIIMIGVLHHMENPLNQLRRCHALLKPGGYLVINEPHNHNALWMGLRQCRQRLDSSYSSDQEFVTEPAVIGQFRSAGFENLYTNGQGFFSTPFAEVALPLGPLRKILSGIACRMDLVLEKSSSRLFKKFSWNLVIGGRKPASPRNSPQ